MKDLLIKQYWLGNVLECSYWFSSKSSSLSFLSSLREWTMLLMSSFLSIIFIPFKNTFFLGVENQFSGKKTLRYSMNDSFHFLFFVVVGFHSLLELKGYMIDLSDQRCFLFLNLFFYLVLQGFSLFEPHLKDIDAISQFFCNLFQVLRLPLLRVLFTCLSRSVFQRYSPQFLRPEILRRCFFFAAMI